MSHDRAIPDHDVLVRTRRWKHWSSDVGGPWWQLRASYGEAHLAAV